MDCVRATSHASQRMQQRGISQLQVMLIKQFGKTQYQKGGDSLSYVPRQILADLRRAIDKLDGVVLVLGEGEKVVTAMHMGRRIRTTYYAA